MIHLTDHAVNRYIERVKPGIGPKQARHELEALLPEAQVVTEEPWRIRMDGVDGFAVLSDGIALAIRVTDGRTVAISCITRGGVDPNTRAYRNARRARRRAARDVRRKQWKSNRRRRELPNATLAE